MREAIVFKGTRDGIHLLINQSVDFAAILDQLKTKLDEAADFFTAGTVVKVPAAVKFLTVEQRQQLNGVLASYGLQCAECTATLEDEEKETYTEVSIQESDITRTETLIIPRTLRSGQRVVHGGAVIVDGDVNPGAEVIAGGNITILGACRGVAHAGAYGNREATITARRLLATQLRIAGLIARSPDQVAESNYSETARIDADNTIVIEPATIEED